MPNYDYSQLDVAVIDTQPTTLRLLRDVLSRLGIKTVHLYDSFVQAAPLLTGGSPDIVLVDVDGPHEQAAFRFIKSFRNDLDTPNPFAVLMVTTWQPTPGQLMRTTNSGADDMITKPVSPKQVQDRLNKLIEARKKFVVTADYIGPDRRKSPRDGTQIPLIDIPNTLRLKALGRWPQPNMKQVFNESIRAVNRQRRMRGAIQVAFLFEYARTGIVDRPPEKSAIEHMARIPAIVDDMQHRSMRLGTLMPGEETLCRAVHAVTQRLHVTAEQGCADQAEVDQARRLVDDLLRAMDPDRKIEDMQQEVESAVAAYRSRLQQMALAKQLQESKAAAESNTDKAGGDGGAGGSQEKG